MAGVVIVGAGEAGARVTVGLKSGGYAGPLTLIGEEAHRPYERPPLSKASIVSEAEPAPPFIADARELAERGVDVRLSTRVASLDRRRKRVAFADGGSIDYDTLVLATGARARQIRIPGGEFAQTLRTHEDSMRIRAALGRGGRLVVIGGGLIGLELAASARTLGCDVVVLEAAQRILTRGVPEVFARRLAERHRQAGVMIVEGCTLAEIRRTPSGLEVALTDGRAFPANALVAGVGAEPDVGLAMESGLETSNGIVVDAHLRTSDPAIYAIGDCASFPATLFGGRRVRLEAWRNAFDQGDYVAKAILGEERPYRGVPWFWSDQYDLTLQITGLRDMAASSVTRDVGEGASIEFHLGADGALVGASALGPTSLVAREMRLAERLVAEQAHIPAASLADPAVKLKSLLRR